MATSTKISIDIPNAIVFLEENRPSPETIIQNINMRLVLNLKTNLGNEKPFKFCIQDIVQKYKLSEVKQLLMPLFDTYYAKGYNMTYKIYTPCYYEYENIYIEIESISYNKVEPTTESLPAADLPPMYSEAVLPQKKKGKSRFWKFCN
jgi:hypothetical protein